MKDDDLRMLERAVEVAPTDGEAKLALWRALRRVGRGPGPENARGSLPAEFGQDWDWREAFAYAGDPEGSYGGADVSRTKAPSAALAAFGGGAVGTTPFGRRDVRFVYASVEGEYEGPPWVALVELWDGRFATVTAGCDYTGWDCQAGGWALVAASLEEAVRFGLDEVARERLGLVLP